jgi:hypothetical protein
MSSLSGIQASAPTLPVQKAGTDADNDNDGTKAAANTPNPATPQVSKPTATIGNYVNTTA